MMNQKWLLLLFASLSLPSHLLALCSRTPIATSPNPPEDTEDGAGTPMESTGASTGSLATGPASTPRPSHMTCTPAGSTGTPHGTSHTLGSQASLRTEAFKFAHKQQPN